MKNGEVRASAAVSPGLWGLNQLRSLQRFSHMSACNVGLGRGRGGGDGHANRGLMLHGRHGRVPELHSFVTGPDYHNARMVS